MTRTSEARPKTLGLFEQRIAGDGALMELARRRFEQACMGAEIHASTVDQLNWLLGLRPGQNAPVVVHLPRDFNLLLEKTRNQILTLASAGASKVVGLVLHDQRELVECRAEY